MKQYFISTSNFEKLVEKFLESSRVFAPVKHAEKNRLAEINLNNLSAMNLSGFRTVEPFKSCFFSISESVSDYFGKEKNKAFEKLTILGARGCDLEALEVEDRVFGEGEYQDPFYVERRENSLMIGADCTGCGSSCFCTLVGGEPYPTKKFDLSLAPIDNGFVVEVGSEKGAKLVEANKKWFSAANEHLLNLKEKMREITLKLLEDVNLNFRYRIKLDESHHRNLENPVWKTLTKDCVECSSCNFICPSCTCFLLADQKAGEGGERHKLWDACLKNAYQKVAGGANPRGKLYQRLQNRYQCKFDYSYQRLKRYSCVGCGRCIDGCAGNIDMRKIFGELEKQVPLTAKLV